MWQLGSCPKSGWCPVIKDNGKQTNFIAGIISPNLAVTNMETDRRFGNNLKVLRSDESQLLHSSQRGSKQRRYFWRKNESLIKLLEQDFSLIYSKNSNDFYCLLIAFGREKLLPVSAIMLRSGHTRFHKSFSALEVSVSKGKPWEWMNSLRKKCYGSSKCELSGSKHKSLLEQHQRRKLTEMRVEAGVQASKAFCILWQHTEIWTGGRLLERDPGCWLWVLLSSLTGEMPAVLWHNKRLRSKHSVMWWKLGSKPDLASEHSLAEEIAPSLWDDHETEVWALRIQL